MNVTITHEIPFLVEKVAEALIDPEFNVTREKLREGVIECKFKMIDDGDNIKLFELLSTEYKRKKTGGLDKSGSVETVTKCRYDVRNRSLYWAYFGEGGKILKLNGVYRLTPRNEKTYLQHDVSIEVNIPIVGKHIAKLIARDFEKPNEAYKKHMLDFLSKSK